MGKKQLIINLVTNIIAFGSSLLISFVLTPYLVAVLGKEAYSFYPIANSFVNYMWIFTCALNTIASRFITIEIVKKNKDQINKLYSSVVYSNYIIAGVLFIPMSIIIIFLDTFFNIPIGMISSIRILFLFVFASMIANITTSVFGVAAIAKNRIDLKSYSELFQGLLRIVLFVAIFSLFEPAIWYVGLVALILSITNLIIQFSLTKKLLPNVKISKTYFDFKSIKQILTSGIWNSVNSLGNMLLMGLSLILANICISSGAAGDLSIVQTVTSFVNGMITVLVGVFIPRITYHYAKDDKSGVVNEIILSQKIVGLISNVPILVFIILGREFYSLWVPSIDSNKLQILSIITVSPLLVIANMWAVYNMNTVMNKVKVPALILTLTGAINAVVTVVLLNNTNFGIYIIPLVSASLSIIYNLLFIPLYASKKLQIKNTTFYVHIFKSIFGSILILIVFVCMKQFFEIHSWSNLLFCGCALGVVGLMINTVFILGPRGIMDGVKLIIKK